MLAAVPLMFAAQQVTEGIVWLTIGDQSERPENLAAVAVFLVFALVVWPLWVPLSLLKAEVKGEDHGCRPGGGAGGDLRDRAPGAGLGVVFLRRDPQRRHRPRDRQRPSPHHQGRLRRRLRGVFRASHTIKVIAAQAVVAVVSASQEGQRFSSRQAATANPIKPTAAADAPVAPRRQFVFAHVANVCAEARPASRILRIVSFPVLTSAYVGRNREGEHHERQVRAHEDR